MSICWFIEFNISIYFSRDHSVNSTSKINKRRYVLCSAYEEK